MNLPFLLCYILYLRAIFHVQAPGGLFNGGFFCVTGLGGLYLAGLIHRGAYFRNFTVFDKYKGIRRGGGGEQILIAYRIQP